MISNKGFHLNEDQILQAVVGGSDLPQALLEHLSQCSQCRGQIDNMEKDLAQLGRMGKQFSPSPRKKVSLPAEKPHRAFRWSRQMSTALGAAVASLVIWFGATHFFINTDPEIDLARDMEASAQFMMEISMLAENALPQEFFDMEETDEEYMDAMEMDVDDDFFQLIQNT